MNVCTMCECSKKVKGEVLERQYPDAGRSQVRGNGKDCVKKDISCNQRLPFKKEAPNEEEYEDDR